MFISLKQRVTVGRRDFWNTRASLSTFGTLRTRKIRPKNRLQGKNKS